MKIGGDVIAAHTGGNSKEFGGPIYLGQFVYNTCTLALAVCESAAYLNNIANVKTYTQSYGNATYTVNDILWSGFVQDDYRMRPDLTMNLGVRYEQQTFTDFSKISRPASASPIMCSGDGKTVSAAASAFTTRRLWTTPKPTMRLPARPASSITLLRPAKSAFPPVSPPCPCPRSPPARRPRAQPLCSSRRRRLSQSVLPHLHADWLSQSTLNPYSEQWIFGDRTSCSSRLGSRVDYVGSHTLRINRPLDVDPPAPFIRTAPGQTRTPQAANCTRPYWIWWYAQTRHHLQLGHSH